MPQPSVGAQLIKAVAMHPSRPPTNRFLDHYMPAAGFTCNEMLQTGITFSTRAAAFKPAGQTSSVGAHTRVKGNATSHPYIREWQGQYFGLIKHINARANGDETTRLYATMAQAERAWQDVALVDPTVDRRGAEQYFNRDCPPPPLPPLPLQQHQQQGAPHSPSPFMLSPLSNALRNLGTAGAGGALPSVTAALGKLGLVGEGNHISVVEWGSQEAADLMFIAWVLQPDFPQWEDDGVLAARQLAVEWVLDMA